MIKFNKEIRLVGIDSTCTNGADKKLSLYFNTNCCDSVISSKTILDTIFMFNGFFNAEEINIKNIGHKEIDSKKVMDEFINRGLVSESEPEDARFTYARNNLCQYTVHFTDISNESIMLAIMLQKFDVKCVFYKDGIVQEDDISQNIYFKHTYINQNISTILQNEIGMNTIEFKDCSFDERLLSGDKDIIINSNPNNWHDSEKCTVINTWNYRNTKFENCNLFNDKTDISEDLKLLVGKYNLAVRSIEDMIYNLKGNAAVV